MRLVSLVTNAKDLLCRSQRRRARWLLGLVGVAITLCALVLVPQLTVLAAPPESAAGVDDEAAQAGTTPETVEELTAPPDQEVPQPATVVSRPRPGLLPASHARSVALHGRERGVRQPFIGSTTIPKGRYLVYASVNVTAERVGDDLWTCEILNGTTSIARAETVTNAVKSGTYRHKSAANMSMMGAVATDNDVTVAVRCTPPDSVTADLSDLDGSMWVISVAGWF